MEATRPDTQERTDSKLAARGRKEQGQEQVIKLESLATKMPQLLKLHKASEEADTDYKEAVKKAAEASGLLAATVNKYVNARAGDSFEEVKSKVQQLALVFDEVQA